MPHDEQFLQRQILGELEMRRISRVPIPTSSRALPVGGVALKSERRSGFLHFDMGAQAGNKFLGDERLFVLLPQPSDD